MGCKKSDFLGVCDVYLERTKWTDDDGICFVEDDKENTCPDFEFIDPRDIPSVVRLRGKR